MRQPVIWGEAQGNSLRVNREEALRYSGCRGVPADEATRALVESCARQLEELARPRAVHRVFSLGGADELGLILTGAALRLPGSDIARHLAGCHACVLLAVTLGQEADRLVRAAQVADLARAVVLDGCASALCEAACEQYGQTIAAAALQRGEFATGRFSPGYGDLPLAMQPQLLRVLEAGKRIGLAATAQGLLVPRKSITAIMGLSTRRTTGALAGCAHCALAGRCEDKQRGDTCGR